MEQSKSIGNATVVELQAAGYTILKQIEQLRSNLLAIEQELAKRAQQESSDEKDEDVGE